MAAGSGSAALGAECWTGLARGALLVGSMLGGRRADPSDDAGLSTSGCVAACAASEVAIQLTATTRRDWNSADCSWPLRRWLEGLT